jgi:chemotaxis protein methyltransferase CheR
MNQSARLALANLEGDDAGLEELKRKIHRDRGFNCHFYKEKCLRRRIAVRMRARGQPSFAEYSALLDQDPAEYDLLLDTLTINVTKFFRNYEMWQVLEEEIVPRLFENDSAAHRIWSAGSASGEEAYSVSILLHEWAARTGAGLEPGRFSIVGTDIDRRSLEAARQAEYPDLSLLETPSEFRQRWFSPGPLYRLREEAKRDVRFICRDLISEQGDPGQSLILCRNVVIYFDREIQERIFQGFYDSLLPGGYLVLGKVETLLGATRSLFRPINNRERVFQKIA